MYTSIYACKSPMNNGMSCTVATLKRRRNSRIQETANQVNQRLIEMMTANAALYDVL